MTRWLRQNTSTNVIVGPFVAYQNGVSQVYPEFVSSSFRVSKNGGPLLPVGNTPTAPFVSGVGLYQWGCSAGVVDTLGTLYFYALPGSAANAAVQVWHEFMVVDGNSYDALFGTGAIRADVNVWNHTSVASITTAGSIPVDIRYVNANSAQGLLRANLITWSGASVAAITTAGAITVNQVYRNSSSVGVGEATIIGSVNVNSWAGTSVAAITTAGSIPVDIRYVNANSAQGLLRANLITWSGTSVAAITTAGLPPVDIRAINAGSAQGVVATTAGLMPCDVVSWQHTTVAAITTAGAIPVDQVYRNHSSVGVGEATITGSVNVNSWAGTSVASVVTAGLIPAEVVSYRSGQAPLQPTVAGRTLDVATGGEAGVDWGNVANAGTTNSLSGTTVGVSNGAITSATFGAGAIDANALASDAVDEILDDTLEGSLTVRQALRIILSALAGKLSGAGSSSITIRDIGDTKNRITATVDVSGNRTSVSLDGT